MVRPLERAAWAAFWWALAFGVVHFAWAFSYLWFPAFGTATLGPTFEWAFSRPAFMRYNLVVAVLFVFAALLAMAVARPLRSGFPPWMLTSGLWTAGALLFLRGAAGVFIDLLALAGFVYWNIGRFNFYDAWFLLGGSLFLVTAVLRRRA